MTKRIFNAVFGVSFCLLLACLAVVTALLYQYFTDVQKKTLVTETSLAAQGIAKQGEPWFSGLDTDGYRITWVNAKGGVLYDTDADAAVMENHAGREEIREALKTGSGESERTSATLGEKELYCAQKLPDNTVVRVSVTQKTAWGLALGMFPPLCIILVAAAALAFWFAGRLSKRIVGPLNTLDLEKPLENDSYEEISPLLTRIERQHRQIDEQMQKLRERQDEFETITGSMSEGLILLNGQGYILSINPAAMRIFSADAGCVGGDMLAVNRSAEMQKLLADAFGGTHSEAVLHIGESEYQVIASPVCTDGTLCGTCLLAFDVTGKMALEQQRREFSANVSHELKTPLQSIMGSAELIENGLVKARDLKQFAGCIRSEAARLVTLIDDIIRLSQLDEGGELPWETLDLRVVAAEAVSTLLPEAEKKKVALSVSGESAPMTGVRRMLYEIVYNLCDNAVKYNVEGGRAEVRVARDGTDVLLTVEDTGIGIPLQAQERVFERFYRVDKSHSKETGGTGLGLSIVKHAAQLHGAKIELHSAPGQGTRVSVRFPGKRFA